MDYNFSSISVDTINSVENKLQKICEKMVTDINNFILVLNNQAVAERSGQIDALLCATFFAIRFVYQYCNSLRR